MISPIFFSHLLLQILSFLDFQYSFTHTLQYTEHVSQTCTLDIYNLSLAKVNPINLIKIFQGIKLQKYFRDPQSAQKSSVNVFTLTRLTAKPFFSLLLPFYANLSVHLLSVHLFLCKFKCPSADFQNIGLYKDSQLVLP